MARWWPYCLVCGRRLPRRRWWQRGLLRPFSLCRPAEARECQRIADRLPSRRTP